MSDYRFKLEPYKGSNTRHTCPACERPKCFARYIDSEGKIQFPNHVGRCDHEHSCSYHYTPKEYFADNPEEKKELFNIASDIAQDFDLQASMNSRVRKRVCHTILSFSPENADKLSNALMTQIAEEYLKQMDVRDTQYLMVRHYDREHPHLHICFNRIDNYGKTINDRNEKYRSTRICKELTEEFGLTFGKGKELVKRLQLKGNDKIRYEIFDVIQHALRGSKDWKSFTAALSKHGVTTHFKHKGKTDLIEGVLFEKDGVTFSGSKIDRSCSYSKLNQHFKQIVAQQAEQLKETENYSETATEDLFTTTYATSDETAEAIKGG